MRLNFNTGDRLIRTKGGVFSNHHALYVGWHNGYELVAENQRGYGVRYIRLNDFLAEGKLVSIERFTGNEYQRQSIVPKINTMLGRGYDLVRYNCEHFVNEVLHGLPKSKQIETAAVLGGGALLLLLLASAAR